MNLNRFRDNLKFRVHIEGFGHKIGSDKQVEYIKRLEFIPFKVGIKKGVVSMQ